LNWWSYLNLFAAHSTNGDNYQYKSIFTYVLMWCICCSYNVYVFHVMSILFIWCLCVNVMPLSCLCCYDAYDAYAVYDAYATYDAYAVYAVYDPPICLFQWFIWQTNYYVIMSTALFSIIWLHWFIVCFVYIIQPFPNMDTCYLYHSNVWWISQLNRWNRSLSIDLLYIPHTYNLFFSPHEINELNWNKWVAISI